MRFVYLNLLILFGLILPAQAQSTTSPATLNDYVAFINHSVEEVSRRFGQLQAYQADVERYRARPVSGLQLASSGPLEEFYYRKTASVPGLSATEKTQLTAATQALWQRLNQLDQTAKQLETYVRLKDYERDKLSRSNVLIRDLQALFRQFRQDKQVFYDQLERIYRTYQPFQAANPYRATEREMIQVLQRQQQLLDSLPYYLNDSRPAPWPVEFVQKSLLADEALIPTFGKQQAAIAYPASDMVGRFREAWKSLQGLKRQAVNDYNFAARQSAQHGNEVYRQLINHLNNDLLASYQSFVSYSRTAKILLDYPKYSPTFALEAPVAISATPTRTPPFADKEPISFATKPAATPIGKPMFAALNGYVDVINESLRQMQYLQVVARNFQSSMAPYRNPAANRRLNNLTFSHEEFKIPLSDFQLLLTNSQAIPAAYRASLTGQLEVLLAMLREMDGLSIELTNYLANRQFEADQWQRVDEILDRYTLLFDAFDRKKERLYVDVRRVFESYPMANPGSSWNKAGRGLLTVLDHNKTALFGLRAFWKLEIAQIPPTENIEATARQLIADEYQNLNGLPRLGRSNGLCPYSPYEDLAEKSLRMAEMVKKARPVMSNTTTHPYQTFYYFYNNELVYAYNKFAELSKEPLLKAVNQPDVFVLGRQLSAVQTPPARTTPPPNNPPTESVSQSRPTPPIPSVAVQQPSPVQPAPTTKPIAAPPARHDTVVIEKTRTDTVYIDRTQPQQVVESLEGFAPNNMVLLLDVSGSMDSPFKLPLLKRSIKSLLKLLRPEDQISVVIYSGRAKLVLKPTSGAEAAEIARVIDELQSDGDTDGNGGLKLAYKVANKNYVRAGNNRIILATDGEFPVSDDVRELIAENAQQDVYLTVFTFGRNPLNGKNLKKLSELGRGSYTHVTPQNANLQLIVEAQAKRKISGR